MSVATEAMSTIDECSLCGSTPRPRRHGVLKIELGSSKRYPFNPKNERAMPRGQLAEMPAEVKAEFVASFNRSQFARDRKRLALLADIGVLFLDNVEPGDRPADPAGLPRGTESGLTYDEAQALAHARNAEIVPIARQPRFWNIIVRASIGAQSADGGAA